MEGSGESGELSQERLQSREYGPGLGGSGCRGREGMPGTRPRSTGQLCQGLHLAEAPPPVQGIPIMMVREMVAPDAQPPRMLQVGVRSLLSLPTEP